MHFLPSPLRVEAARWTRNTRTTPRDAFSKCGEVVFKFSVARCEESPDASCKQVVVCDYCRDEHRVAWSVDGRVVPCTHCPRPCNDCRGAGGSPYCRRTPCPCGCHGSAGPAWFEPTIHGGEKMHVCTGGCGTIVAFDEQRMCDACAEGAGILQALSRARKGAAENERAATLRHVRARAAALVAEMRASDYPVTRTRLAGASVELEKIAKEVEACEHLKEVT